MKKEELTLRELIDRAKGDRNISQFAEDCGVSPATMYKIAQGNIRKKISESTLDSIIDNAAPQSDVTKLDFVTAEGLVLEYKKRSSLSQRPTKMREYEEKLSYLIPGLLVSEGYGIRPTVQPTMFGDITYAVTIDDDEELWTYDFLLVNSERFGLAPFWEHFYAKVGKFICHRPSGKPCRLFLVAIIEGDEETATIDLSTIQIEIGQMHPSDYINILAVDSNMHFLGQAVPKKEEIK